LVFFLCSNAGKMKFFYSKMNKKRERRKRKEIK